MTRDRTTDPMMKVYQERRQRAEKLNAPSPSEAISLSLPSDRVRDLEELASQQGTSKETVARELLAAAVKDAMAQAKVAVQGPNPLADFLHGEQLEVNEFALMLYDLHTPFGMSPEEVSRLFNRQIDILVSVMKTASILGRPFEALVSYAQERFSNNSD